MENYNIQDFELGKKIGEGGFATVYEAKCKRGNLKDHVVAIKKINKSFVEKKHLQERVKQEISIHKELKHPNIVQCYATFEDKDFIYLILELCKWTLDEYIKKETKESPIPEVQTHDIILQIVKGMIYLHGKLILHRDLSLRNILVTVHNEVKISDFGFATRLSHKHALKHSILGTPNFQSPEILNGELYGLQTDCWSLGCVIFAVIKGELPFDNKHVKDVKRDIITTDIQEKITKKFTAEARELVIDLLNKDDSKRIDIAEVMESAFLKKYPDSRRENGSYGDSGMGSINNSSFATYGKYSHQSLKTLDSGLDSLNYGANDLTRCYGNYNTTHLNAIYSSGDSYQSSNSKSRRKHNFDSNLKLSLRSLPQNSRECLEKYGSLGKLKNQIQALPSRQSPLNRVLPYKTTDPIAYPGHEVILDERNWSEANNLFYPVQHVTSPYIAAHSDRRERSVSEEQRKQSLQKRSNSCDVEYAAHQSKDRLKKSEKKRSERRSQHSSPHKDKSHSSNHSHHSKSNTSTKNFNAEPCRSKYSNNEVNYENRKKLNPKMTHQERSILEQKPQPLNTKRLRPCRYPMKKFAVVSILGNEEVCVELLKTKKEKQYVSDVLRIFGNGDWIYTYKLHSCLVGNTPPPKPEDPAKIKNFSYEDLPQTYWKMYRKAKVVVDFVRATTPKITYYDKKFKCVMMENNPDPDFEMEFFDGGNVSQKSSKVTLTNEWGKTILLTEMENSDEHFAAMWEKFNKMKEWCKYMEKRLEHLESYGKCEGLFPAMFGNPPLEKKPVSANGNSKENIPHHSSGQSTISKNSLKSKSHEGHTRHASNSSNKYTHTAQQQVSLSSPKMSNIEAIFMKLKSKPKLIDGKVKVEYIDGCVVWCSKDEKEVKIYDSRNKCIYNSQFKNKKCALIDSILQDLPCIVSVAVFSSIEGAVT